MSQVIYRNMKQLIDRADHVLLLTDERIDGDTLGSTLGMYHALQEMGKQVRVFSPNPLPSMFTFMPGAKEIVRDPEIFQDERIDLVMIFDCSDGAYIKDPNKLPAMRRKVPIIVVDHHDTNPHYGTVNLIEPRAASTADVVWRFLKDQRIPVGRDAAQCILTGICHDTNTFSTSNTTAESLDAAHELARRGARLQEIVREIMLNKSVETLRLWGVGFERLHYHPEFDAMCTALTLQDIRDLNVSDTDTKHMINFLNAVLQETDAIVVLKETEDGAVKGSLRSQTRDVAALAESYGGGGHMQAAGFKQKDAYLEEEDGVWHIRKGKKSTSRN